MCRTRSGPFLHDDQRCFQFDHYRTFNFVRSRQTKDDDRGDPILTRYLHTLVRACKWGQDRIVPIEAKSIRPLLLLQIHINLKGSTATCFGGHAFHLSLCTLRPLTAHFSSNGAPIKLSLFTQIKLHSMLTMLCDTWPPCHVMSNETKTFVTLDMSTQETPFEFIEHFFSTKSILIVFIHKELGLCANASKCLGFNQTTLPKLLSITRVYRCVDKKITKLRKQENK